MRFLAQAQDSTTAADVIVPLASAVVGGVLTLLGGHLNQRRQERTDERRFAEDRAVKLREQRREAYVRYWRRYEDYLATLSASASDPGAGEWADDAITAAGRAWNEAHHEVVLLADEDVRTSARQHRKELDQLAVSAARWRDRTEEERERLATAEEGLSGAMTFEVTR